MKGHVRLFESIPAIGNILRPTICQQLILGNQQYSAPSTTSQQQLGLQESLTPAFLDFFVKLQ